MKSSRVSLVFSHLTVISLVISLLCVQTMIAVAVPTAGVSTAEITVSGPRDEAERAFVVVNGERAFSGRTFISNGTISTTDTSSAIVSLGKLGRIELQPSTSLSLNFSENVIAGQLQKGTISVASSDGVFVSVSTPKDVIANDGLSASRFTVSVAGEQTSLGVQGGNIRHNGQVAQQDDDDDDDDDDHWKAWAWVGVIGGAIATILIIRAVTDEDDDVSPVR